MMLALSVSQLIGYLGYVALGGLLMFRALITPDRGRERRVVRIALIGLGLLVASTLLRLVVVLVDAADTAASRVGLPVALVQLGVLVAVACYLPDLLGSVLSTWRRALAVVAAVLLTVALVLPMIVGASAQSAAGGILAVAHVLAIGTWIGGMVAVALLVLPTTAAGPRVLGILHVMLRRSRVKVIVLVAVLVVTGSLSLLFQPGRVSGLGTAFWVLLVAKVVLFAILIFAAAHVRRQIQRAAFRVEHIAESGDALVGLRRIVRIEMVVAAAAVAATAVLTVLTPIG